MYLLEARNICAGYGKLQILFDINFYARSKELVAIIGPNGSGKSTFLKTLFGLTNIYKGEIYFQNKNITSFKPHERAREGLAYLPQTNNSFENLTVRENLIMATYGLPEDEAENKLEEVLIFLPRIKEFMSRKVKTLSGGERQMVAMAMALTRQPKVIMLDEPTAALAPKVALEILNKIVDLKEVYGMSVVLVEQNAKKALEIGDRAYLFVAGRVMFSGKTDELLEDKQLTKTYLGLS
ncbi:MAG: ABC transporter ATP-binding protein [Thermofilum sp. ex4484_79]|nr:MAG: ABC transporter ATP-binding protein [Thermofilum sp. ex4484_79]